MNGRSIIHKQYFSYMHFGKNYLKTDFSQTRKDGKYVVQRREDLPYSRCMLTSGIWLNHVFPDGSCSLGRELDLELL